LALEHTDSAIILRYSDDGRGIDPERLRAVARGIPALASRADTMNAKELTELIFRPGFSTAESASVDAGRGIGMALVNRRVAEAGGKLGIKTAPGRYTEFVVTLPIPEAARAVS
jgi:chemotaxis protein histidine kinase CheA